MDRRGIGGFVMVPGCVKTGGMVVFLIRLTSSAGLSGPIEADLFQTFDLGNVRVVDCDLNGAKLERFNLLPNQKQPRGQILFDVGLFYLFTTYLICAHT
jgi:hypothetical protein